MKKRIFYIISAFLICVLISLCNVERYAELKDEKVALSDGLEMYSSNTVEYYGAYGDGIHDDTVAIQNALDAEDIVCFSSGKTYKLISNGLSINKDVTIFGNESTILIDDTYAPQSIDFRKRILRSNFSPKNYLKIQDLNFEVCISDNKYLDLNYLVVMQPTYIDNVILDNVNINIEESVNTITNLWFDHGCDSIVINNCSFTNNTSYKSGGIFWLMSDYDKACNKYNEFKNVKVTNSDFIGTCGDEAIAIWGLYSISAQFDDIKVDYKRKYSGTSKPLNIIANVDSAATFNINFFNSDFCCGNSINGNISNDSLLSVGTKYASNKVNVYFENSKFYADVRDCFIRSILTKDNIDQIEKFNYLGESNNILFKNCDIICNKTITGANEITSTFKFSNPAVDCSFEDCSITCEKAFAYLELYSTSKWYYTPKISVKNSNIKINNAIGFVFKTTLNANCGIDLEDVKIYGFENMPIMSYRYKANVSCDNLKTIQNNEMATDNMGDVYVNDKKVF